MILISNFSINRKINNLFGGYFSELNFESKADNYLSRLNNESFPDYVKERIKREIKKIKKSSGGQTNEAREEYVEQVMSFPWHQVSPENNNLAEVEQILNKNHLGMKKVKELIIEYLVTKKQV